MVKNVLKEINEYVRSESTSHIHCDRCENTIIVSINDKDIYQRYSNYNALDSSLYDFIEESYKLIEDKRKPLKLNVNFDDSFDAKEKKHILNLIRIHYVVQINETKKNIKRTNINALILLLIGAFIMSIYGILLAFDKGFVIREIIGIFSWVFLWESCGQFFFSNNLKRLSLYKYIKLKDSIYE